MRYERRLKKRREDDLLRVVVLDVEKKKKRISERVYMVKKEKGFIIGMRNKCEGIRRQWR